MALSIYEKTKIINHFTCETERELQGRKRLRFSPGVFSVCDPGQPFLCQVDPLATDQSGQILFASLTLVFMRKCFFLPNRVPGGGGSVAKFV